VPEEYRSRRSCLAVPGSSQRFLDKARGLAADVNREGRGRIVKELLGVIVGKNDPEVRIERTKFGSDVGCNCANALDIGLVLRLGHGEELGGVGQHGPADDGRLHGGSPLAREISAQNGPQQAGESTKFMMFNQNPCRKAAVMACRRNRALGSCVPAK